MTPAISLTVQAAAEAAGVSPDVVRRAIRAGLLVAHYPTSRPVVLVEDLRAWIESSPREAAS